MTLRVYYLLFPYPKIYPLVFIIRKECRIFFVQTKILAFGGRLVLY